MAFSLAALALVAGTATAQSEDPTDAPRWLETDYDLELDEELTQLNLTGTVDIHETEATDPTLRNQCGESCSADELRRLYQRAGSSQKEQLVQGIEASVAEEVEGALASFAGDGAEPQAQADVSEEALRETPEGSDYQPPIPVDTTGSVELSFLDGEDLTQEQVQALFRMGARVDQPVSQDVRPGANRTIDLSLAGPLGFLDAGEGDISADGNTVTWTETNWKSTEAGSIDDQVVIGNPDVRVPSQEDAKVNVTLDIADVNANYGGLLGGGNPADAQVTIAVDGSFQAIENPRSLDRVRLPYLSADAVRIALDQGLLDANELTSFEDRARDQIKSAFKDTFGTDVDVTGGLPKATLSTDEVGDPPGTGSPIELNMSASERVPFPPEGAGSGAAAFTVTSVPLGDLTLPSLDTPGDVPATITLILPNGVALSYENVQGATVEESEIDGRQAYTFTSTSSEQPTVQGAEVAVNHPFVWDLFWPLLLFLFLLLVVLPAVLIIWAIRKRREPEPRDPDEDSPIAGGQASQREPDEETG